VPRWHYLKVNHRVEIPRHLFFFDCETKPELYTRVDGRVETRHRFWFAYGAYLRQRSKGVWCEPRWFRFENIPEFWRVVNDLCRPKQTLHCFAHNLGFDLRAVDGFHRIPTLARKIRRACLDDPPTIIDCRLHSGRVVFLDTLNWWRVRVADLGERIGLPKLPFPGYEKSMEVWNEYCHRDVEVIMESVRRWLDWLVEADMGSFKQTLAGQSLSAFRHRYMEHKILLDRDPLGLNMAREAYHGGRVECLRLGEIAGPIHQLDINSQYPYVMRRELYPAKFRWSGENPSVSKFLATLNDHAVVARVDIETDVPVYGLYRDHKLVFPVGRFTTALTTPELKHAVEYGHLRRVHAWAVYTHEPLFRTFVDDLYQRRLDAKKRGDEVGSWQFKILMNALYGKWAQRGREQRILGECDPDDIRTELYYDAPRGVKGKIRRVFGKIFLDLEDGESAYSHPAIAAHVTAYARMLLWDIISRAGEGHVLYVDTDSVFVDDAGMERLTLFLDPAILGALKLVGTYDRMIIFGPKDYLLDDRRVLKGVRSTAVELAPGVFEQEQWVGLAGAIQDGVLDAPIVRTIRKTLRREYTKGTVDASGRVHPFRLSLC
jgi:DNA polymerase type B, organellar and viral